MANTRTKKRKHRPERTLTAQLNVRVPEELFRRVNMAAAGAKVTLTKFVTDVLDKRTEGHKADVQRITERESVPKKWQ